MTTFVAPSLDFDWPEFQQPFKEAEDPHVEARFDDFNLHFETYTTVGKDKHEIKVLVLVPKILDNGPYPVHVKWHGGGFATGSADFRWWMHAHLMRLARHAVIIIPNHCLMPEHNGKEIMSNTTDFWNWFQTQFPVMMKNMHVPINKDRLLVSGESAGAFLAVYSWLTQPEAIAIKALYLQYPMLFHYNREPGVFFGRHVSLDMANKHLDKCLAEIQALKETGRLQSISAAHPPKHMTMAYCLSATKRWKDVFNHDDIEAMLRKKSDKPATFPEMYVYHGDVDVQVPIQNTHTFINIVEQKWPEMVGKIHFTTVEGQAHAGDYEVDERKPGKEWLRDMLKGIQEAWLA